MKIDSPVNAAEVQLLVDSKFSEISERHYKNSPWAPVEAVVGFLRGDELLILLYKEL